MTRHPTFYKKIIWIVTFLLWGCGSPASQKATTSSSSPHQQKMLEQSKKLENLAYQIESQIDEIRRANEDTKQEQREKLATQMTELQNEHAALQDIFQDWKESLKVSTNETLLPVESIAPKQQSSAP